MPTFRSAACGALKVRGYDERVRSRLTSGRHEETRMLPS